MNSIGLLNWQVRVCLTVGILFSSIGFVGCDKANETAAVKQEPPLVYYSMPEKSEVQQYEYFTGTVRSPNVVELRPRVAGYLEEVFFTEGREVKEGDPLFLIDPRPFEAERDFAVAEIARYEAEVKKTEAELARNQKLLPSGAVSQEEFDTSQANRAGAQASLEGSKAAVRRAELDVEFSKIVSPINGRISRAYITKGNYVAPGDSAKSVLTKIVSVDPMHAYFSLDEKLLQELDRKRKERGTKSGSFKKAPSIPVFVQLASEKEYSHPGYIDYMDNAVNPLTGTIELRAVLDNEDRFFIDGLFVRIRVPRGEKRPALMIPEQAIGTRGQTKFVYIVNSKDIIEKRDITLGLLRGKFREILPSEEGITATDRVITQGILNIRENLPVKPELKQQVYVPPVDPELPPHVEDKTADIQPDEKTAPPAVTQPAPSVGKTGTDPRAGSQ